jgi:sugar lactone lactonase YvrE
MHSSLFSRTFVGIVLCVLLGASASAHPGSGIVVDKDGQVFFTDTGHGVWKIDRQGNLTPVPAQLFHWMALDEAGHFAETRKNFGEWFERVTPQSARPTLIISSDFPLTTHRDGNFYYADTRPGQSRIVCRTPDGRESILAADDSFKGIAGIAVGPDGSFYVTIAIGRDTNVIRRITMDGRVSQFAGPETIAIGRDRAVSPPAEAGASYCRGLTVDPQGNVYVAATGSRRVLRITENGGVSTILQAQSPWSPTGVAVLGGEVYVLEWQDPSLSQLETRNAWIPRVRKLGRDGKITTLATVQRATQVGAVDAAKLEESGKSGVPMPAVHQPLWAPVREPTIKAAILGETANLMDLLGARFQ